MKLLLASNFFLTYKQQKASNQKKHSDVVCVHFKDASMFPHGLRLSAGNLRQSAHGVRQGAAA